MAELVARAAPAAAIPPAQPLPFPLPQKDGLPRPPPIHPAALPDALERSANGWGGKAKRLRAEGNE